jgi:HPt (histidine-containing phosphotransfer) domain-containing protein
MTASIDLAHLEQYVFGDRALLDEILTIFIEQASMWIERMDPSLDDEAWRSAAHTLKGASRGVGAWALGDLAEKAETLVGGDKTAARTEMLESLRQSAEETIAFASEIRDRPA